MSISITMAHRLNRVELFFYEDGEKMMFYARDDDHAELIVNTIQRGITNELEIIDEREI